MKHDVKVDRAKERERGATTHIEWKGMRESEREQIGWGGPKGRWNWV